MSSIFDEWTELWGAVDLESERSCCWPWESVREEISGFFFTRSCSRESSTKLDKRRFEHVYACARLLHFMLSSNERTNKHIGTCDCIRIYCSRDSTIHTCLSTSTWGFHWNFMRQTQTLQINFTIAYTVTVQSAFEWRNHDKWVPPAQFIEFDYLILLFVTVHCWQDANGIAAEGEWCDEMGHLSINESSLNFFVFEWVTARQEEERPN